MKKEDAKTKVETIYEEIQGGVNEVIKQIRNLIKEGSARKLIIKNKHGKTVFQTQLAFGVSGAALIAAMAPVISAIGMFAMFINDYQVIVEREISSAEDEYSVDAEFIDIKDEEESEPEKDKTQASSEKEKQNKSAETEKKDEKTVGKKKSE